MTYSLCELGQNEMNHSDPVLFTFCGIIPVGYVLIKSLMHRIERHIS